MAYLQGCSDAFTRQADVVLLPAGGAAAPLDGWVAHSQLLSRAAGLFADVLEAAEARHSAAAPLRVELPTGDSQAVQQVWGCGAQLSCASWGLWHSSKSQL